MPSRFAEADATAIAPTPTRAARRARAPLSASAAAIPSETFEWSAAWDEAPQRPVERWGWDGGGHRRVQRAVHGPQLREYGGEGPPAR
ncbi:hypothetical protein SLI_1319 [Streptomyces lividans 1326]|uniref:Uncharacterized protein n=1 Tax=Streptomyces lividans 1326 TaxID=1200984 RepID=A0A7U9DLA4_STRLI|nr:hypothetical protein SLI_1319 [Streptomyces lividans 1326]